MAGERQTWRSCYVPPNGTILGMMLSSLIMVLLTLAGAALIEESSARSDVPTPSCLVFEVGSQRPAMTHIHLENHGQSSIGVRLDYVDDTGVILGGNVASRSMAPQSSDDIAFRTPALGTAVKVMSTDAGLYAATAIVHDDDAPAEICQAVACIA